MARKEMATDQDMVDLILNSIFGEERAIRARKGVFIPLATMEVGFNVAGEIAIESTLSRYGAQEMSDKGKQRLWDAMKQAGMLVGRLMAQDGVDPTIAFQKDHGKVTIKNGEEVVDGGES